ncbi:MAG TPA: metallophosphoesterase [Pyrinomonadaceae bacterium]|nr:metallophosphoesterase [Pyrinomonadaceae bacterium]
MKRFIFSAVVMAALILSSSLSPSAYAQTANGNGSKNGSAARAHSAVKLTLPLKKDSLKFAVMGDTGTGSDKQQQVADKMVQYYGTYPFEFVLMLGDNMYGGESAKDFEIKFAEPYKQLLDKQVKFYAALGNHDQRLQKNYVNFNMNGKEYYRFKKGNVAFYALNSTYMDKTQVKWLEDELAKDTSEWKVAFMHHPPYSSGGKHGSDDQLREVIEPIFVKYGVNVVLTGHDHFYERIKPQKGIHYFVSGAAGKLRTGDIKDGSPLTAKGYDRDLSFMLIEVDDKQMHFQAISRTGETIDSGVINHPRVKP